ncbi:REP-associated tyrosine transposase [Legionella londiniensis]|uniref:Transposase IS200 like protein n=1 Tax=Legionella londiniensis TaxID=45068 RepID=A0A0W0VSM4_9GAMM|nr:transposase [Legionella londiniensis]KTD22973.1 Transposase IS200 like protein [Legionella londiniensis]STX92919.1 Transposase and inactivated derivatives [Legionella londiniensis]
MVYYRRDYTEGAIYFFTLTLHNRRATYLTTYIHLLGKSFRDVRAKYPFSTLAVAILPDHLHIIWQLPDNECNYSMRWRLIKTNFTKSLLKETIHFKKNKRGEYQLWQSRFWEHRIRDETDLQKHVDYIHYNPVKHGYAAKANQWPHSSIHRYIKEGIIPCDWACEPEGDFNE